MGSKIAILIIESDKDIIESVEYHLGTEFNDFDYALNWEDGFKKICNKNYDLHIVRHMLWDIKGDSVTLFKKLEQEKPEKLNSPFIISFSISQKSQDISKILYTTPHRIVYNDTINYLYELEWAIINLVPKAFYNFKQKLNESIFGYKKYSDSYKEIKDSIDKNKNNRNMIEEIRREQHSIKEKYISWEKIAETLGIIIATVSLSMGIIVSFIVFLSQNSGNVSLGFIKFPLVMGFIVTIFIWSVVLYLIIKARVKKWIKKFQVSL